MKKRRNRKNAYQKLIVLTLMVSLSVLGIVFVCYGIYNDYEKSKKAKSIEAEELEEEEEDDEAGYALSDDEVSLAWDEAVIYIGDSRFVGMNDVCGISSVPGRFVVAEVGQGHKWLTQVALSQAEYIESTNPGYRKFYYVICLGVNDLVNIDEYVETYKQLGSTKDLILVSVGPVGPSSVLTNDQVAEFNSTISSLGFPYIDYNSVLMSEGFSAPDGLHYDDDTYRRIYDLIKVGLGDKDE
jgi:hypothetical protein